MNPSFSIRPLKDFADNDALAWLDGPRAFHATKLEQGFSPTEENP